jgi:hypothetical protein
VLEILFIQTVMIGLLFLYSSVIATTN